MGSPAQSLKGSPVIYANVEGGASMGNVWRPLTNQRIITGSGELLMEKWDVLVCIRTTGPTTFRLMDLNLWMINSYGLMPVIIKDMLGTNNITVWAFEGQFIDDDIANITITARGTLVLWPLMDRTGWVRLKAV